MYIHQASQTQTGCCYNLCGLMRCSRTWYVTRSHTRMKKPMIMLGGRVCVCWGGGLLKWNYLHSLAFIEEPQQDLSSHPHISKACWGLTPWSRSPVRPPAVHLWISDHRCCTPGTATSGLKLPLYSFRVYTSDQFSFCLTCVLLVLCICVCCYSC